MSLKVEEWPIDRLVPYARNPRKNDAVVAKMVSAIREFGFRIPIVAKSDGSIVDGHLRYKAALEMGLQTVPVALADELTETQVKAFRLLANRSANWAEWDDDLLKLELEELQAEDFPIEMIGFEPEDLNEDLEKYNDLEKYTSKIATPIYEPTGKNVVLSQCIDLKKYENITDEIKKNKSITDEEKDFLLFSATRHIVFHYANIAEYYSSNASSEMKRLMEDSALIIIDMDQAIEKGFVQLTKKIQEIMEYDEA